MWSAAFFYRTVNPFSSSSTDSALWWLWRMSRYTWMTREDRLLWGQQNCCLFIWILNCVCVRRCSGGFIQVFDATNTTRERRDLIHNFAKDNAYKVGKMLIAWTITIWLKWVLIFCWFVALQGVFCRIHMRRSGCHRYKYPGK